MKTRELTAILKVRFEQHMNRHPGVIWDEVESKLSASVIEKLGKMETTGGEVDVIEFQGELYYVDMSKETPVKRRSICYDKQARENRKKYPPTSSAEEVAKEMGIEIVSEEMYYKMQEVDNIDLKTSSWLKTQEDMRKLGGAIFGDKRYNRTFIYCNEADSYYGVRGFRGYVKL